MSIVKYYIGNKIKEKRLLKGLTQENLSRPLGLSFQQLQKYEKGANRIPSDRLYEISKCLECDLMEFFPPILDTCEKVQKIDCDNSILEVARLWNQIEGRKTKRIITDLLKIIHKAQN